MLNKCGIYVIKNRINNKEYIGLSNNIRRRWNEHKDAPKHPRKDYHFKIPLYQAIRKYGIDNFEISIIEECPIEKLKEREVYWIEKRKTYDEGYNATRGGDLPEGHVLKGEQHGMSKLSEEDVLKCRDLYQKGFRCVETWESQFSSIISFGGFQRMWHGRTWKHVRPEVFLVNPHPGKHITQEQINDIREKYKTESVKNIHEKYYKGIVGYGSIWDIVHYTNRFKDK